MTLFVSEQNRALRWCVMAALTAACAVKSPAHTQPTGGDRRPIAPPSAHPEPDDRAAPNLVDNPSFENALDGWQPLWLREPGRGGAAVVTEPHHDGKAALKIEHFGGKDWSMSQRREIDVKAGDIYEFSGFVKTVGVDKAVTLSVITKAANGTVLEWIWGGRSTTGSGDWKKLAGRFLVPPGCAKIQFRITGEGPGTSFWDELRLTAKPRLGSAPASFDLARAGTRVHFDEATDGLGIIDEQGGYSWILGGFGRETGALSSDVEPYRAKLALFDPEGGSLHATIELEANGDIVLSIVGTGRFDHRFEFPGALVARNDESWVLPINEGLLIPAGDRTFQWDNAYALYSGHGLSMPFVGLTDGRHSLLMIAETPDDALVVTRPLEGSARSSSAAFAWQPSRGSWRYRVRVRRVDGGYVAIAKAYRQYAASRGLVVTLEQKARENPNVDALIGAADVWWWKDGPHWTSDPNADRAASALARAGIDRALWSNGGSPAALRAIHALGWLTGRYDIVQDVWSPDTPLPWVSHEGWPEGLVLDPNGDWVRGWVARDGEKRYPGGVICSKYGLSILDRRVRADLVDHPYQARFLDTTTASPLRECYNPAHPESRSDDRRNKVAQLELLSRTMHLVTGSETGMDLAVPAVDYFEGMMSLGPYRLPDSGYDLFSYRKPDAGFLTFQIGPRYRIPLFELVYHDCVVSYWYWGDASNRIAEAWDARDLFNALYATPPVFVLDETMLNQQRTRLAESYRRATLTARRFGKSELVSHEFLDPAHLVQRTRFAGGGEVIANFGDVAATLPGGARISAHDYIVRGRNSP